MRQYLMGGSNGAYGATDYSQTIQGEFSAITVVGTGFSIIPTNGVLSNFIIYLSAPPGVGGSRTFDLYIEGSNVASVTMSLGDTVAFLEGPWPVSAGDDINVYASRSGSPASSKSYTSMLFTGSTENESILLGGIRPGVSTANRYGSVMGFQIQSSASETGLKQVVPTSGTLRKLYAETLSATWGVSGDAYRVTLIKNGVATSMTCTITAPATKANDTSNDVSVSTGDTISFLCEPLNSPLSNVSLSCGLVFVPDVANESLLLGCMGTTTTLVNSATRYFYLTPTDQPQISEASAQSIYPGNAVLKKLYVELEVSPYQNDVNNDWYKFTVRPEGEDSALTVTIADGGTGNKIGYDNTNTITQHAGKRTSMSCVPNSSPLATGNYARWGLVQYVEPYPTGAIPTFIWPL